MNRSNIGLKPHIQKDIIGKRLILGNFFGRSIATRQLTARPKPELDQGHGIPLSLTGGKEGSGIVLKKSYKPKNLRMKIPK